jgi:putative ABC transport system substrate-binding protein
VAHVLELTPCTHCRTASKSSNGTSFAVTEGRHLPRSHLRSKTAKGGADAVFIVIDPLLTAHRVGISILAVGARLPTISGQREFVDAGSLISYGPNFPDLFRRAGDFVDKILRGAKPADLPIEQPTKFDLVVNLTTAKALGLTIPQSLLAVADEVIE